MLTSECDSEVQYQRRNADAVPGRKQVERQLRYVVMRPIVGSDTALHPL